MSIMEMDRCSQTSISLLIIPQLCLKWASRAGKYPSNLKQSTFRINPQGGNWHVQFSSIIIWKPIFWNSWISAAFLQLLLRKAKVKNFIVNICLFHTLHFFFPCWRSTWIQSIHWKKSDWRKHLVKNVTLYEILFLLASPTIHPSPFYSPSF